MEKTKNQMLVAIYEKMAQQSDREELQIGCKLKMQYKMHNGFRITQFIGYSENKATVHTFEGFDYGLWEFGIVGMPVLLTDVLEWFSKTFGASWGDWESDTEQEIINDWNFKKRTIDEQSEQYIKTIYSLIPETSIL